PTRRSSDLRARPGVVPEQDAAIRRPHDGASLACGVLGHDAELGVRAHPDVEVSTLVQVEREGCGPAAEDRCNAKRQPTDPGPHMAAAIENPRENVKTFDRRVRAAARPPIAS